MRYIQENGGFMEHFKYRKAINYSGYRQGQSPLKAIYPSKEDILEDLRLLEGEFYYIRLFDCSLHSRRVLEVIKENQFDFKVLMGLFLSAEENHINHPYFYVYPTEILEKNKSDNARKVDEIIALANRYRSFISAISVGNETRSIWNNNRISEKRLVDVTQTIQSATGLPVTYCEEYQHWLEGLEKLAETVDFISLHTYPAWQGLELEQAIDKVKMDYQAVQDKYPGKYCIITETGWPTKSHGSKIKVEDANINHQERYIACIQEWAEKEDVLVYIFEAFDELWKGENHPDEPEKNWGLYDINRQRKHR
jgi:exo-beta-1,3-glucanase (GH17 family)